MAGGMSLSAQMRRVGRVAHRKALQLVTANWREAFAGLFAARRFMALRVPMPGRTVLLIEPNEHHAEVLPGFCAYFRLLGYAVVLIVRERNAAGRPFARVPLDEAPVTFVMGNRAMRRCLRSARMRDYELVFITSTVLGQPYGFFGHFLDYVGRTPKTRCGFLVVEHSFPLSLPALESGKLEWGRVVMLSGHQYCGRSLPMVNPHYFGRRQECALPEHPTFVTVGAAIPGNRDFEQLRTALLALQAREIANYRVIVIGAGEMPELVNAAPGRVVAMGRVSFPELYGILQRAHFLLPLLDSGNPEHRRYLSGQTTGSRQLVLGFNLVPVINELFARAYGFDGDNAVTYEGRDLIDGMLSAINMPRSLYDSRRRNLSALAAHVRDQSLRNLAEVLKSVGSSPRPIAEYGQGAA